MGFNKEIDEFEKQIAGAIQYAMFCKRNNANVDFEELSYEQARKIVDIIKKALKSQKDKIIQIGEIMKNPVVDEDLEIKDLYEIRRPRYNLAISNYQKEIKEL